MLALLSPWQIIGCFLWLSMLVAVVLQGLIERRRPEGKEFERGFDAGLEHAAKIIAATGDRLWEDLTAVPKDRWSTIHFVKNGDKYWLFTERGELIIARLAPDKFHEISRTKLIDPTTEQLSRRGGVCWAHPAFANRHVFQRNDNELVCASLEAEK